MKKFVMLLVLAMAMLLTVNVWAGTKVQVCHIPPDDPSNFHTITVNTKALSAHLAHGDLGGSCDSNLDELCDDGNACTVDVDYDNSTCLQEITLVDCNDDNACTTDSCDASVGCVNEPVICEPLDACTNATCAPDTGECVDSPIVCAAGETCQSDGECAADDPDVYTLTVGADDKCDVYMNGTPLATAVFGGSITNLDITDSLDLPENELSYILYDNGWGACWGINLTLYKNGEVVVNDHTTCCDGTCTRGSYKVYENSITIVK